MTSTPSFDKFNYTLRPSKQVERKLIVELLHKLSIEIPDYDFGSYTYLGLGSVYYTDFVLFHKYLYIDRMICAESENIPKRMTFNRPYDFIDLHMQPVSDVIPKLERDIRHLVWLDYDTGISEEQLWDIGGAIRVLAPGSFILITVDGEPRIPDDLEESEMSRDERKEVAVSRLEETFGSLFPEPLRVRDFTPHAFPEVLATIIGNQLREAAKGRDNLEFAQLVNFRYKDGAQMVSLGGLVDCPERITSVRSSRVMDLTFVNEGATPLAISVPPLTAREKLWLDQQPEDAELAFEVEESMVRSFRQYRRYYPSYHESLL